MRIRVSKAWALEILRTLEIDVLCVVDVRNWKKVEFGKELERMGETVGARRDGVGQNGNLWLKSPDERM